MAAAQDVVANLAVGRRGMTGTLTSLAGTCIMLGTSSSSSSSSSMALAVISAVFPKQQVQ
jgi:hypothetical protein